MWLPLNGFKVVLAQSQEVQSSDRNYGSPLYHHCDVQRPQRQRQVGAKAHQARRAGGRAIRAAGLAVGPAAAAAAAALQAGRHRGAHCLSGLGTCINTGACKQR